MSKYKVRLKDLPRDTDFMNNKKGEEKEIFDKIQFLQTRTYMLAHKFWKVHIIM